MSIKAEIEEKINNGLYDSANTLITEYESINQYDMDLLEYKIVHNICTDNLTQAKELAIEGIKKYPTSGDMHYNYAYICELEGKILDAYEEYTKASFLYEMFEEEKKDDTKVEEIKLRIADQISEQIDYYTLHNNVEELKKIKQTIEREETYFGLYDIIYNSKEDVIGTERWLSDTEKRFVALRSPYNCGNIIEAKLNMLESQAELIKGKSEIKFEYNDSAEALIPIASTCDEVNLKIATETSVTEIIQKNKNQFHYYRVEPNTIISSDKMCFFGEPIKLGHSKARKKLVLNIFIDGLSQVLLSNYFDELMPNTNKFFSDGVICNRAYSTGEWTYPSLASYVSGLQIPQHMCFHPKIDTKLPDDIKLLAEYFKEKGYYTAKIDGEWRSTPNYGHTRGYDRYIYQNQGFGSKIKTLIGDIIEHIDTFKETDQFIWTCFGDLHDVADGYDLPITIQCNMDNGNRVRKKSGITSVKQDYDENKIIEYKKYIKYIDLYLNILFSYIRQNFKDEDVVVSIFSDHGQGYLVPENEYFISKFRTNVAFMFKGDISGGYVDELMSICDYPAIMCKLSNIAYDNISTDSNLPVAFGGKAKREYVISESLHPGDEYRVTLYYHDYSVYFETKDCVDDLGRVKMDEYSIVIKDNNGNIIQNEELLKNAKKIIFDRMSHLRKYDNI